MSNKYYGRSLSSISRDDSIEQSSEKSPDWLADFAKNLEKEAVKSKREDASIFDQVSQILGAKSKYSSVEEAVLDMQKRTGLYDLLNKKASAEIELFKNIPNLKNFIDNFIESRHGLNVSPESVSHQIVSVESFKSKLPNKNDIPNEVKEYINKKIMEVKDQQNTGSSSDKNNIADFGKADLTSSDTDMDDPLSVCDPNVE
jgi:hypothetical protein